MIFIGFLPSIILFILLFAFCLLSFMRVKFKGTLNLSIEESPILTAFFVVLLFVISPQIMLLGRSTLSIVSGMLFFLLLDYINTYKEAFYTLILAILCLSISIFSFTNQVSNQEKASIYTLVNKNESFHKTKNYMQSLNLKELKYYEKNVIDWLITQDKKEILRKDQDIEHQDVDIFIQQFEQNFNKK